MINFYDKLPKDIKQETKLDKDFKNHHILPNSMIAIIGGTGSGKSNALCNLISKQSNKYYDIIIFNPVSTDEPLLKLLKQKMPELKLISDIEELPSFDIEHLKSLGRLVAQSTEQRLSEEEPLLSATLPNGFRIQIVFFFLPTFFSYPFFFVHKVVRTQILFVPSFFRTQNFCTRFFFRTQNFVPTNTIVVI